MEPSMNDNHARAAARRAAARRRQAAKRKQRMLWILCGALVVILAGLLICIWLLAQSGDLTEDPVLKTEEPGSSLTTTAPTTTAPTTTAPTEPLDEIAPEIQNATDRMFWLGDNPVYTGKYTHETKDGVTEYQKVTATDNSGSVELTVDRSAVLPDQAGTYPVIYIATDPAGNKTEVQVSFIISEKPVDVDEETQRVYDLAQEVLDKITTEDMTDMEVAFAIYQWTKSNIGYVGSSDKSSWTGAAYQAFTERSGDCYNYFAAAKAMFDVAGIENVDVVKSDTSHSSHYWSLINLGDGWYHVDCTPRRKVGYFFMNTDAELEAYSVENKNSHIFDGSLYPERATESVQHLVDYANGKIKD